MDALGLLLTRSSYAKLSAPAPSGEALENILKAGLRAPDHANLSPFKFIVCQNDGLQKLADIYYKAAIASEMSEAVIEKSLNLPFRAPMIVVGIMQYQEHEKVPRVEQIATTACAMENMQMAAYAQGFNGMWRTGAFAHDANVKTAFGLSEQDEIIGYLYLGTPENETPIKKQKEVSEFVEYWD